MVIHVCWRTCDAASAEPIPAAAKTKDGLPDWLAAAAAGAIAAETRPPDKQKPASVTSGISKPVTPPPAEQPVPTALDTSAESFTFDENVPDWLSDLPGTPTAAAIAASNKPTAPLPSITPAANQQPPAQKSEIPDWLVGATATAATAKAASVFTEQSSSAGDEALAMEMPDWLSGIKSGEMEKPATPVQGESVAAGSESLTPE